MFYTVLFVGLTLMFTAYVEQPSGIVLDSNADISVGIVQRTGASQELFIISVR